MDETWVCIVEGDGEAGRPRLRQEGAVPLLLRRLVHEKFRRWTIRFKPYNAKGRETLTKAEGLEEFLTQALRESNLKAIIVILDAETDDAAQLATSLAERTHRISPHVPVAIVIANKCYEAWLIGGLCMSETPETIGPGRAKAMLNEEVRRRGLGSAYVETLHQARLTSQMSLGKAYRRCPSFRRFISAVKQLLKAMDQQRTIVTP